MSHRQDVIGKLRAEEETLHEQIESVRRTVDASSTSGIREFRRHRLGQLLEREGAFRNRLHRIESSKDEAWPSVSKEAESLWSEIRGVALVVAHTFH